MRFPAIFTILSREQLCTNNVKVRIKTKHRSSNIIEASREAPWMLMFLLVKENVLIGGGNIISDKWAILTAYSARKSSTVRYFL